MFEWDHANAQHIIDHGVYPPEAQQATDDPHALATPAYEAAGEERFALVGETEAGRLLFIVYTWRGDRRRVVTPYPANRAQRRAYEQSRP